MFQMDLLKKLKIEDIQSGPPGIKKWLNYKIRKVFIP